MEQSIIHVGYVEPNKAVRQGISALINNMDEIVLDVETDNGEALIKYIEQTPKIPDICILELDLKGMSGFSTAAAVKENGELWAYWHLLFLTQNCISCR